LTRPTDDLEGPDFDGRQFSAGDEEDLWPSRSHGWALVLAVIFAVVGFSSLRAGSVLGAVVMFALSAGVFALTAAMVRKELRKFMNYRRRI
jgi:hypothetical protein